MTRFFQQSRKVFVQITQNSSLRSGSSALIQHRRSFTSLGLFRIIMGKVHKVLGAGNPMKGARDDTLTSKHKDKKSLAEKVVGQQAVKFKTKSVDSTTNPSTSKNLAEKIKKIELQKGILHGTKTEKMLRKVSWGGGRKPYRASTAGTDMRGSASKKKRCRKSTERDEEYTSIETGYPCLKKTAKEKDKVPLAVEMPLMIDASNCSSGLNTTLDSDDNKNTSDSVSDIDSSIIPLIVHDYQTPDKKKDDLTDVPLAVVMPIDTSGLPTTNKVSEGKQPSMSNVISQDGKIKKSNFGAENFSNHAVTPRRTMSQKDQDCTVLEKIKVHLVGNCVVLQLTHPVQFFIFGQVKVQVLHGEIQILGYKMGKASSTQTVSSLRGSSFLSIETDQPSHKPNFSANLLTDVQDQDAVKGIIAALNPLDVCVLFKEGNQEFQEYIQKYLDYPIAVKELKSNNVSPLSETQEMLNCIFQPDLTLGRRLNQSESWKRILDKVLQEKKSCTVLCGGKGVGKSTLLRYLVNQTLSCRNGSKEVVVLDFDPGQAELTPPGCVAVSVVKEPLLGPNYTHLQQPERCIYIGEISVVQCIGRYIEAAADIIKFFRESPHLCNLPCIVNTMGFTQGIGVTIMGQLLKLIRPSRVVQIESKRHLDNYPFSLTAQIVLAHSKSSDSRCIRETLRVLQPQENVVEDLNYEFILLQSAAEAKSGKDVNVWGMKPKVSRDAVILSYFSSIIQPPSLSILDDIPFSCPLGSLFLCVAHEKVPPNLILAALNGNLVALCTIDPRTSDVLLHEDPDMPRVLTKVPVEPCIGFGIVRGVDMNAKMLYLTTPLKEDKLSMVNCVVYGAVSLPKSVYIKSNAPGIVPYVSSGQHPDLSTQ